MSILAEIKTIADGLHLPVETGAFKKKPPDIFLVLTPMSDIFPQHADNSPQYTEPEVRLSLYVRGSYTTLADALVRALLRNDFTVTGRQYVAYESDTGYHHYEIDVTKVYPYHFNGETNE